MSLFSNISRAQDLDKSTVKTLDLSSYLGTWYELARFDHTFERGMQEVMAFYELRDDGKIDVINSGIKNGKYKVAYGKAKLTDETGVLRVSFFGPFYSDYRVLMLDDDYEYALVGGKNDKYLWILSRNPELEDEDYDKILTEASRRGYDISRLIWIDQ
ncbi:MAG: lipocalin family protein [Bacteroidales bacterium]|nr:lipocalin family protein [Bacteroidales bacterium]